MTQDASPRPGISPVHVGVLYAIMAAAAYACGFFFADRNIFFWHEGLDALELDVAVGAGVGLFVVALSQFLDRFQWSKQLSERMKDLLGNLGPWHIAWFALCSGVAEEMLFRGLLQPSIGIVWSSLIFGLLHIGPDRRYLPWTMMAIIMGFGFGGLYLLTGNLLAPILAHFTINYFNLHALMKTPASASADAT